MTAKPTIHFVRPLLEAPTLHALIAANVADGIDSALGDLIGADAKEYVCVPADADGFIFVEAILDSDGRYVLAQVPADQARALVRASLDYRKSQTSLPS